MRLAILGEFDPAFRPHAATNDAIRHSRDRLGIDLHSQWLSTADVTAEAISDCDGLWIAPGSPYKSMERTLEAIRYARENAVPCLGTCGGCQHMIIEYARNVVGIPVLKSGALKVVGSDAEGEVRVLELPEHPFFIATLFVPQARSRPEAPHPLVSAFLLAIVARHGERARA